MAEQWSPRPQAQMRKMQACKQMRSSSSSSIRGRQRGQRWRTWACSHTLRHSQVVTVDDCTALKQQRLEQCIQV